MDMPDTDILPIQEVATAMHRLEPGHVLVTIRAAGQYFAFSILLDDFIDLLVTWGENARTFAVATSDQAREPRN